MIYSLTLRITWMPAVKVEKLSLLIQSFSQDRTKNGPFGKHYFDSSSIFQTHFLFKSDV